MADQTKIEWSDATWNPVVGCTHVSAGCDHCYAAREASGRLAHLPLYAGLASGGKFTGEVRTVPERLDIPLRWKRPRRIFVNSMSDLFHDDVPDEFIARVFRVMGAARQHTFQVLTKRHARMRSLLNSPSFDAPVGRPNVWLGVSAENQQWADIRIPALLDTPAAVRWVSAEPLLGRLDLAPYLRVWRPIPGAAYERTYDLDGGLEDRERSLLDWVVTGGESGPGARPADPAWCRLVRDQCVAAGVPYLHKQNGEWAPNGWRGIGLGAGNRNEILVGPALDDMGHREVIERVGKKRAGRLLDGREWNEYPDDGRDDS